MNTPDTQETITPTVAQTTNLNALLPTTQTRNSILGDAVLEALRTRRIFKATRGSARFLKVTLETTLHCTDSNDIRTNFFILPPICSHFFNRLSEFTCHLSRRYEILIREESLMCPTEYRLEKREYKVVYSIAEAIMVGFFGLVTDITNWYEPKWNFENPGWWDRLVAACISYASRCLMSPAT
ncbi:hypothetical protein BO71DRAFT_471679 [Aspergillus ellipticus CBS 707.79]|uniref:Uncharacterized protein n=1 Tax=Aspergillus ellipticus CBS 707.79 TaxID=1448320 RepID=A0A319E6U5_9EURO|nr:hypothetical protein BO71DRAFT_471679 [Aspergillus ellipticus CBS 707.79]